ncbi:ABC transporter substrate-binding protein [Hymenobacter caeli]|uniref:Peptide/nickel transport system substrate-binding protein n=1 Tax=Hymenobacter caeli TaxID=2735894 RepID=A0ABX2FU81_9BACT|nr:ABC transporter substrate-binding protein [Hymenobacter caeli]NRT20757.1 peptide/nickel transport system substrate-binding protein [Hymenobacter caeli]
MWTRDPESLDPLVTPNQSAIDANNLLHLCLLSVDYSTKRYAPALADSLPKVQFAGDSLTLVTYHLRPTATWDGGRPVLARDVAFTLKLMQVPGLPNEANKAQFGFIRDIRFDPTDPRRFTLVCNGQAPGLVQESGDFLILPEAALDPKGSLRPYQLGALNDRAATAPADSILVKLARRYARANLALYPGRIPGSGPYQLVRWDKDHLLRFQRKPHWWADALRPAPPVLEAQPSELDFVIIPNEASAALALRRGSVNVYPQVPVREFRRLQASAAARQQLAFYTSLSYDLVYAGFNTRRPALSNRLTRQALGFLFDPKALLLATQAGLGQCTVGLVHPTDTRNYADSLPPLALDPARAVALLRQAGWHRESTASDTFWTRQLAPKTPPQRLTLLVRYRAGETAFETIGLQFRAAAARLGIAVELRPTENASFSSALQAGDFDVYLRLLKGNPFYFNFAPILHSKTVGAGNLTGFGTPASDRLIEAIPLANTLDSRARLLRKFQRLMREEMPLVPLFFRPNCLAADRRLVHLYPGGLKPGYAAAAIKWTTPVVAVP